MASNRIAEAQTPHAAETPGASPPRSVTIASSGIRTDRDASEFLSALIGDVMAEQVPVRTATTAVNAMGKLLKVVEMRHKYGNPEDQSRRLELVQGPDTYHQRRRELLKQLAELDASDGVANQGRSKSP